MGFIIDPYRFGAAAANTHSIDLELSSAQYLSITDAAQTGLDITTSDFTFEAWVNFESLPTPGNFYAIVSKDGASTRGYYMHIDQTTHKLRLFFRDASSNNSFWDSDAAIVEAGDLGNWMHLACVVDISVPSITMYKNGSSIASTAVQANATTIQNSTASFRIGGSENGNKYFDGKIDDVRIWSDIRTSGEISSNYQAELTGSEANLVGYWKLNNDLLDETSNNNDMTNNNSAVFSTDVPF